MRPPRVTSVSLTLRGRRRDAPPLQLLVHAGAPLDELQRCIAAGFAVAPDAPLALRDPERRIVYPLSLLPRSPELFARGTFTVLLDGESDDESDGQEEEKAKPVTTTHAKAKRSHRGRASHHHSRHHNRHRHAKRSERLQRLQEQVQVSRSSSLHLDSSDDDDNDDDDDRLAPRHSLANDVETEDDPEQLADTSDNEEVDEEDDDEFVRELDLTDFELPQVVNVFTQACPTGALDRTTFNRCLEKILSQVRALCAAL